MRSVVSHGGKRRWLFVPAQGAQPIHEGDLNHGAGFTRMLAENRKAPDDIFRRIDEWRAAVIARSQEITSLTRVTAGGYLPAEVRSSDDVRSAFFYAGAKSGGQVVSLARSTE